MPPFDRCFLEEGLAVHFRCHHPEAAGLRIDIMSRMRGLDPFQELWTRRTTIEVDEVLAVDVLALPDLVRAKKTQRDKDWPMLARLVEANSYANKDDPTSEQIEFWPRKMRPSTLLCRLGAQYTDKAEEMRRIRPLLACALPGRATLNDLDAALHGEEQEERRSDRKYWEPLRKRLTELRQNRIR